MNKFVRTVHTPYHLVLLDYHIPDQDSLQIARTIHNEFQDHTTKIVMLSSNGSMKPEVLQQAGISEFLPKPVKQNQLLSMLHRVLSNDILPSELHDPSSSSASEKDPDETAPSPSAPRILLVEDNEDNQRLIIRMLEKMYHAIDIANNGKEAVEAIMANTYNLVLMNVQMPVMDGFEASKTIRQWEKEEEKKQIPIIALTAHAIEGYRDTCLQHGMRLRAVRG